MPKRQPLPVREYQNGIPDMRTAYPKWVAGVWLPKRQPVPAGEYQTVSLTCEQRTEAVAYGQPPRRRWTMVKTKCLCEAPHDVGTVIETPLVFCWMTDGRPLLRQSTTWPEVPYYPVLP